MALWWRVYYGDGTVCTSDGYEPWDLPRRNVQVIITGDDRCGWQCARSTDYYVWQEGKGWSDADIFGLFDYLVEPRRDCVVLFGRTVPDQTFHDILERALGDPTLPKKNAWRPNEPRRS